MRTLIRLAATALTSVALLGVAPAWATEVTFRMVDQSDISIPMSRFSVTGYGIVLNDETVTLPEGDHEVRLLPGISGLLPDGWLYRNETISVTGQTQTIELVWKTAPLAVDIVDQDGFPIPGSRCSVAEQYGTMINGGDAVVLPVTEDPDSAPIEGILAGGYPLLLYPGIAGEPQIGWLYREEGAAELTEAGASRTFTWKLAELAADIEDQHGEAISPSSFNVLAHHAIFVNAGDALVLPVTEDAAAPTVEGTLAGGYPLQLSPGIAGEPQIGWLSRVEPAEELTESGLNRLFTWKTAELALDIQDQYGVRIPASTCTVQAQYGIDVLAGEAVVLPVTEDAEAPPVQGMLADGYPIELAPGIADVVQLGWLTRDEAAEELSEAGSNRIFTWRTALLVADIVDQDGHSIPESRYSVPAHYGVTVSTGDSVVLPVTEDADHSPIQGILADGYRLQLSPGIANRAQIGWLFRDEATEELTIAGLNRSFTWKTAELSADIVDQNSLRIPGSRYQVLANDVILAGAGASVVLPVTEDGGAPAVQGTLADGYPLKLLPGIAGAIQIAGLFREEAAEELTEVGASLTFTWYTANLTVDLLDQNGVRIPGSEYKVPTSTITPVVDVGDALLLPVTEDPTTTTIQGTHAGGYDVVIGPGFPDGSSGASLNRLLRAWGPVELSSAGAGASVVWEVASGRLVVVDGEGVEIPGASISHDVFGTIGSGEIITLPVTDPALYPTTHGSLSGGYSDLLISPEAGGEFAGPFVFQLLHHGLFAPDFVEIAGESYGLRYPLEVISVTPADGATEVPNTTNVTAEFNFPVDPATVHTLSFYVFDGSTSVPGSVSLAPDGLSATFDPNSLAPDRQYRVLLTSTISDQTGTRSLQPFESYFDTILPIVDIDSDGVLDEFDNCPDIPNALQSDCDSDGTGDGCDPDIVDADSDLVDDACDNCPGLSNPDQADRDTDGVGDSCDICPLEAADDADGDGYCCPEDNCCTFYNLSQSDQDSDGVGDACEAQPVLIVSSDPADTPDFPTVQEAVDAATDSGTTVLILPGLGIPYGENVLVDRSLAIRFEGVDEGGGYPVIDGAAGPAFDLSSTLASNPIRIRNLRLRGESTALQTAVPTILSSISFESSTQLPETPLVRAIDLNGARLEATHLTMGPSVESGIDVGPSAELSLKNSEFRNLIATAILLRGTASLESVLIAGPSAGIELLASGADLDLRHATLAGASGPGVDNSACGAATIAHSILYGNSGGDLLGDGCTSVDWSVVGSVIPSIGSDNLQSDPLFVGGDDYHLQSGSDALDHGPEPSSMQAPPCLDLDGQVRLLDHDGDGDVRIDPGAYERLNTELVPGEVLHLRATSPSVFEWDAEGPAAEYHVYRGMLSGLGLGDTGSCGDVLDPDHTDTKFDDASLPSTADGYFYLITADDTAGLGGAEGSRGYGMCEERAASVGSVCQ